MATVICWFHQDLRIGDHPALDAAIKAAEANGATVVPLYILDDQAAGRWAMGGASRWWLHHSLTDLDQGLGHLGAGLVIRRGDAEAIIPEIVAETGATSLFTSRRGEPWSKQQLDRIAENLKSHGVETHISNSPFLIEPGDVLSKTGNRMRVFTPFKRNLLARGGIRAVLPRPQSIPYTASPPQSLTIEDLGFLPKSPDWSGGLQKVWRVGEAAALNRLQEFLDETASNYHISRDHPSEIGTSRLSPHLHFGELSPVTIYHAVMDHSGHAPSEGLDVFLSEVIWREFSYELIDQFPDMPDQPLRPEFAAFPWRQDYHQDLAAWQKGMTGYPLIDAGMRELYETGWMHNRVRMITASFLTKHLLIPWQEGEAWFFDTLVDADLASNAAGWQWVAGCGADASPYFRVFNPITQGTKFDAAAYVRRWCPELRELDDKSIFAPFDAPPTVLLGAGVTLGRDYPHPLISHPDGRKQALDAFAQIKSVS